MWTRVKCVMELWNAMTRMMMNYSTLCLHVLNTVHVQLHGPAIMCDMIENQLDVAGFFPFSFNLSVNEIIPTLTKTHFQKALNLAFSMNIITKDLSLGYKNVLFLDLSDKDITELSSFQFQQLRNLRKFILFQGNPIINIKP